MDNRNTMYVYVMASKPRGILYIGVTNNLIRRVYEHKNSLIKGFTSRYKLYYLVYYEYYEYKIAAIEREKQLKRWKRQWKINLIEKENLNWRDLYKDLSC